MPKLFNEFFGVTSVCVELGLEVFEVFECAFLAQGGEEIDFYRVAVYVFGKVKNVDFYGFASAVVEGRACAYIGHAAVL